MNRYRIFQLFLLLCIISPVGAATVHADTLGQSKSYHTDPNYDASGAATIQTTLRAVGQHGYFYVDNRYYDSLSAADRTRYNSALQAMASQFDTTIYPRSTALWGFENTPGVDGDSHVVVVLERMTVGSGGYFQTINGYSVARARESNAREMVYVNAVSVLGSSATSYLAHEFQHLISFNQRELLRDSHDDIWLNEARSEFNITVSGYSEPFQGSSLQRREQNFLQSPSDSLVEWLNKTADYAIASIFAHYFADRFGPPILASTLHTTVAGTAAVEEGLVSSGVGEHFGDVFTDWMVASFVNDRTVNSKYGYTRPDLAGLHVSPAGATAITEARPQNSFSTSLKDWQPFWLETAVHLRAGSEVPVHVRIDGDAGATWRGAVVAYYSDGARWVSPFVSSGGTADVNIDAVREGGTLYSTVVALTQGIPVAADDRDITARPATIRTAIGTVTGVPPLSTPAPSPGVGTPAQPADGDLIRRIGQPEIYVIAGAFRRNLVPGILALYGFQNRPVLEVTDQVFFRYIASNYIRALGGKKVFAVWPDNTKHWINVTPEQWSASGRQWAAIFTVNDSEINFYGTGPDVTR